VITAASHTIANPYGVEVDDFIAVFLLGSWETGLREWNALVLSNTRTLGYRLELWFMFEKFFRLGVLRGGLILADSLYSKNYWKFQKLQSVLAL
jgi:hypothetical protein